MDLQDLCFSGYGISYEYRCGELPVLVQEYGAGARHIHRDQRIQEPRGQAALDDQMLEPGLGGK